MKKIYPTIVITALVILGGALFTFYPRESAQAITTEGISVKNITDNEAYELLLKDKTIKVLDIRTPEEFFQGHIKDAINIDFYASDFQSSLSALDSDTTYLIYCASGRRSSYALSAFKQAGIKHVLHMNRGFNSWRRSNLPTHKL